MSIDREDAAIINQENDTGFTDADTINYVFFDPNTISKEILVQNGLSDKQASTLINYRLSGGKFFTAEDFRKIYGISSQQQDRILPYIRIEGAMGEARKVKPPSSLYIPDSAGVGSTGTRAEQQMIFLNAGDSSDYEQLKGIGPVLSGRIIKYRALLGGFASIDQLNEVYGLREEVVDLNRDFIIEDRAEIKQVLINSVSYRTLLRHPYIDRHQAETIIRYRDISGPFTVMDDLIMNKVFTLSELERIKPYISLSDSLKIIE